MLAVVSAPRDAGRAARGDSPVAALAYPESAARALGALASSAPSGCDVPPASCLTRRASTRGRPPSRSRRRKDGWLSPEPRRARCSRPTASRSLPSGSPRSTKRVAAARELGFPAVVKTAAAGAHKTESGGVALDLRDEDAVRAAVARIGRPVIVQPFVQGGVELLAGVVQDPVFGPLVAFGPGGVLAELIGEAAFRLAPLTDRRRRRARRQRQGGPARRAASAVPHPQIAGAL